MVSPTSLGLKPSSWRTGQEESIDAAIASDKDMVIADMPTGSGKSIFALGIARKTQMEIVIIRPPLVYGPGVKANFAALKNAVARGSLLPLGAVNNRRSMVALDNLVDFIVASSTHPKAANETFLVSDGQDLSTAELVRSLAQVSGVPERLFPVPVWVLRTGAALVGKQGVIDRLCSNLQVDITKARNVMGWTPPIPIVEGLRRAVDGLKAL